MVHPPPALSVVVPVRNEAGNVAPLCAEIHAALRTVSGQGYEVIFVDDASTDGTAAELAHLAAAGEARVVTHARRCGQSQATLTGVDHAAGAWIATLDGDGQNNPADLLVLLAARAREPVPERTLFIGRRAQRHDSGGRVLASRFANAVRQTFLGDATPDSGCGLKLLARPLFLTLPRFDALHRFMPALVLRAGGNVVSVPVSHRPRLRGRSKYGIVGRGLIGVVDLLGVMWLMRRHTQPERLKKG
jgi:dolichol-phosphate mannosyltransferase